MKHIGIALLLLILPGCLSADRVSRAGCGVDVGLKLCVHATRESANTVIVDLVFEKMADYNWSLRAGEPVHLTWYDASNQAVGRDRYMMIFGDAFQSGGQRIDERNARFFPPKSSKSFSAKFGQSLVTERTRIRE